MISRQELITAVKNGDIKEFYVQTPKSEVITEMVRLLKLRVSTSATWNHNPAHDTWTVRLPDQMTGEQMTMAASILNKLLPHETPLSREPFE